MVAVSSVDKVVDDGEMIRIGEKTQCYICSQEYCSRLYAYQVRCLSAKVSMKKASGTNPLCVGEGVLAAL